MSNRAYKRMIHGNAEVEMWVRRIEVTDFLSRSDTLSINLNPDLTIITGRNGAGKTSLLKLIWYVISGNILLALQEVPFSKLRVETDRYTCDIIRTGQNTCEIKIESGDKIYHYVDITDEDGDVIENAEDRANSRLQRTGSSVFLPTFRRIEGGFTLTAQPRGPNTFDLFGIAKERNTIEDALANLSKKLTNKDHVFVAAISTVDITDMLVKRHTELSSEYAKSQSDMSQGIVAKIKMHKTGSDRDDAEPANKLLDSIIGEIETVERQRATIMAPTEAIQKVVTNIFHHSGIKIGGQLSFGDAAAAINSESLSAGEKQMLSFIAYNGLRERCVFLIDEPELSLHVDWQRQIFSILREQQSSRFRGQSLTGDSDLDSRLTFGGSLGRADWRYRRGMGSDRAVIAA